MVHQYGYWLEASVPQFLSSMDLFLWCGTSLAPEQMIQEREAKATEFLWLSHESDILSFVTQSIDYTDQTWNNAGEDNKCGDLNDVRAQKG